MSAAGEAKIYSKGYIEGDEWKIVITSDLRVSLKILWEATASYTLSSACNQPTNTPYWLN